MLPPLMSPSRSSILSVLLMITKNDMTIKIKLGGHIPCRVDSMFKNVLKYRINCIDYFRDSGSSMWNLMVAVVSI